MAQRVTVLLQDDLDGSEADRTFAFSFDGVDYEIDLSNENLAKLQREMSPWTTAARRVGRGVKDMSKVRKSTLTAFPGVTKSDLHLIRVWAEENGYQVADRGRIANDIIQAWLDRPVAAPVEEKAQVEEKPKRAKPAKPASSPFSQAELEPEEPTGPNLADVRAWLRTNGYNVPKNGHVNKNNWAAYMAANA
jgi:hypothetical protein